MDIKLLKWGVVRYTLHSTMNCNEIVLVVQAMTNGELVLSLLSTVICQLQSRFQYDSNQRFENHLNHQEIVSSSPFCCVSLHECKGIDSCIFLQNHFGSQ